MHVIGREVEVHLDWLALTDALAAGHKHPRAEIRDSLITRGPDTLLTRSAWIDGLGLLVKAATIFPGNTQVPAVNGGVTLYSDRDGQLEAVIDFHLLTKWKTAGDSLLAARRLARKDSRDILIVGAGSVGLSLTESYRALFPDARFTIWARRAAQAQALAATCEGTATANLEAAVRAADVIATATMTHEPLIKGEWLRKGQHLDLIGAYKSDMREADDDCFRASRIFVDSRATTLGHIGEIDTPIRSGAITAAAVLGDFYDLDSGTWTRAPDDITLFKNGGGAHLDLICARYVLEAWKRSSRNGYFPHPTYLRQ